MIPEEVAEIASILRYSYPLENGEPSEDEFAYSVQIAWQIYNLQKDYDKAHLEGSY